MLEIQVQSEGDGDRRRGILAAIVMSLVCCAFAAWGSEEGSALPDADDVKDVPAIEVRLDKAGKPSKDGPMHFAIIGLDAKRDVPAKGYRVLFVLPGGTGTLDFHPFVKRIHKNVLDDQWITIQLERPFFAAKQADEKVWPTRSDPWPGQAFAVEDLVKAAFEHTKKQTKIDSKHVFMLGWSSSGPACYATMLQKDTVVKGAFIAMSVFYEKNLPPLGQAKGRAFYLYHAKGDAVCKYELAEQSRSALEKVKAKVELVTYEGEHGWPPTIYPDLKKGIDWLSSTVR